MNKLAAASLLAAVMITAQERPAPHMEVFRGIAEALANRDADAFLDHFDPKMAGYDKLRAEVRELLAVSQEIGSTIDVISDEGAEGDEGSRSLQLDWLLAIDSAEPRRQIVKCRAEKQGKKWRITALEPVEFFSK
jgi:hypothetical protein